MNGPGPRFVAAAVALATLAWIVLAFGLIYAGFIVTEAPPNVVISFSSKGLTRLFVELLSLGLGATGFLVAIMGFARGARHRAIVFAAGGSAAVCIVCLALLM